jgi:uncharacterized protein
MSSYFSAEQLDVMSFARARANLDSHLTLDADGPALERLFGRLVDEACEPQGLRSVTWHAQAELRPGASGDPVPWLCLDVGCSVRLVCQRCLTPADVSVVAQHWFRFVADEATAAAEDDDSDEDVLALEPRFNLIALVEDELLMAIPLVPMHDVCPGVVPTSAGEEEFQAALETRPSAFAALAQLKKPS